MPAKSYHEYIEEVDLQRYWLVLKRRWLPATLMFVSCVSGAFWVALSEEDSYTSVGKLLFQVDRSTSLTGVGREFSELETVGRNDPLFNEANLAQALPVLQDVIDELELDVLPEVLRRGLSIRPQGGTDILLVTHTSADPEYSTNVVNQLMATYIERNIELNRAEATAAREFVEQQIPTAKLEQERTAEELRQFYLQNQIVNVEGRASTVVGTLASLDNQINDLQVQLASLTTQITEIQQLLGLSISQARRLEALTASTAVQNALARLEEIETLLAVERSRYTESHPSIVNLMRQETSLKQLLNERVGEVLTQPVDLDEDLALNDLQMSGLDGQLAIQLVNSEVDRLTLISRLTALEEQQRAFASESVALPTLELQQRELQQNLNVATRNYDSLIQRLQESRLAENQVLASVEIIEPAEEPLYPTGGRGKKLIVLGAGAGVFLGITLAFALDLIDKSIKTVKDGEALLGYPLLGLIPRFGPDTAQPLISLDEEGRSPRIIANSQIEPMAAASYQMLQANLKFISSDHQRRAITVTSSVAQEGKSEVCANLAATIAQAGKKVLLVDADMRSPSQHHFWNVINRIGLSHVLVGEGNLSDAKQEIDNNLTLITAGVTPPNPLALIDSERMNGLVQSLLEQYDYVIFDTPPLAGAADAALLGKASDGILFVLRPRWGNSTSVLSAKSFLERAGAEVLGIVANGVNIRNEHEDYVVQLKAGAYPHNQTTTLEKAKGGRSLTSVLTTTVSSNNTYDEDDPFKNL